MYTYTQKLSLPFGNALFHAYTSGELVGNHEFLEIPREQLNEDLDTILAIQSCQLGAMRVKLEPGDTLHFGMILDPEQAEWDGQDSFGLNTVTLTAQNEFDDCVVMGVCNNEWHLSHDPGLEILEWAEGVTLFANQAAIVPMVFAVAYSRGQALRSNDALLSAGYDPDDPTEACQRAVDYALTEWLGKRECLK